MSRLSLILLIFIFISCNKDDTKEATKIIFLHHSTGNNIWNGENTGTWHKIQKKLFKKGSSVEEKIKRYNKENNTNLQVTEQAFPKDKPYGWENYPYDYYNIWVKNAGDAPYKEEPTLEMLTKGYQVIVWKHCFPTSDVVDDTVADINSKVKSSANYKLQYQALKEKMHSFPQTKFVVWTGAAQVKNNTTEENAKRAGDFFDWVVKVWDEPDDNIYLWDFRALETYGGLYFLDEFAENANDSHPNAGFSEKAAGYFVKRLTDIIANNGEKTNLIGEEI